MKVPNVEALLRSIGKIVIVDNYVGIDAALI